MSKTRIFTTDVQLYTTKSLFGDHVGADWGYDPSPSLKTSPGWGDCDCLLGRIDTPAICCLSQSIPKELLQTLALGVFAHQMPFRSVSHTVVSYSVQALCKCLVYLPFMLTQNPWPACCQRHVLSFRRWWACLKTLVIVHSYLFTERNVLMWINQFIG